MNKYIHIYIYIEYSIQDIYDVHASSVKSKPAMFTVSRSSIGYCLYSSTPVIPFLLPLFYIYINCKMDHHACHTNFISIL
jgi:hypothetical protein